MQATIHTPVLQQDISVAIKEYKSSDCALHLFLTPDSLAFGELSVETKVLNSYKKYAFPTINGNAEVVDLLKWLFANDEVLLQKYFTTTLSYFNEQSVLLPMNAADDECHLLLPDDMYAMHKCSDIAAANARYHYTIPSTVQSFFAQNQCWEVTHASATLIAHLFTRQKFIRSKTVYVHLQSSLLEVIAFDQEALLMHNIFPIKTAEDFIYFVLSCYEGLGFSTSRVNCVLIGDIDKPSKIFDYIFKYLAHFEFSKEPIHIKYSSAFEDQKMHQFYSFLTSIQ